MIKGLFILFGFIAVNCQECEWPNQFGWTKSIASSFYITPVDIGMFDSGEVLNSVFSTNITSNDFVQRSLITSFLESRVAFLNANPDNPQYFLLGSEERTHWRILLTQILRHLENFPFDTSAHLWASKIYKRLGDSIQSIEHAKSALRLIDEILVQLSKSYRNDGGIKVRTDRFNAGARARTYIATDASNSAWREARVHQKLSKKLLFANLATEILQENYRIFSKMDDWVINQPPTINPGVGTLPFTGKSSARHALQQFHYLCDVTANSELAAQSKKLTKEHGCIADTGFNISQAIHDYKHMLQEVDKLNAYFTDPNLEKDYLVRGGVERFMRDANDFVIVPDEAMTRVGTFMFRDVYTSTASIGVPSGRVINMTTIKKMDLHKKKGFELGNQVVVIDDVFTTAGLEAFRNFTLETTMWHAAKQGGYMCAFLDMGFASPLVAQAIAELQASMPDIFCDYRLTNAWGYKYADGDQSDGINIHGDMAAVNVNCWIVPESDIKEATTGGMVIWPTFPPANWSREDYNIAQTSSRVLLQDGKYHPELDPSQLSKRNVLEEFALASEVERPAVHVPYRSNRCVIFDSSLLHASDTVKFGKGYKRRRVNLTFLFGFNGETCQESRQSRLEQAEALRLMKAEAQLR